MTSLVPPSSAMWDIENYQQLYLIQGHESAVSDVAFGPEATQVTTASWDNSIRIWDINTRRLLKDFQGHTGGINRIDISDDGRFIVSGSDDASACVWENRDGRLIGCLGDNGIAHVLVPNSIVCLYFVNNLTVSSPEGLYLLENNSIYGILLILMTQIKHLCIL